MFQAKIAETVRNLHPDQFTNDKQAQEDASQKLSKINEIFANIFKDEVNLELYKKVCQVEMNS